MQYEIEWKWEEFGKALHFEEVTKHGKSSQYRIYVFFTDQPAQETVYDIGGTPIPGVTSLADVSNVLYVGMIKYSRKEELKEFPMRIGERILAQGHPKLFSMFEYEPNTIYLAAIKINDPHYKSDEHIGNIEGYLIERLGPRYNGKRENTSIIDENTPLISKISHDSRKTEFTSFMEFEINL